jgi:hypothetical protein
MSTDAMPRTALTDFLHYLSTGEDPSGLMDENVRADMNFPHNSFTVEGKAAFDVLHARASDTPWVLDVEVVEPTPEGVLAVIDIETSHDGQTTRARTITTVTLNDDRVVGIRHWCTGAL